MRCNNDNTQTNNKDQNQLNQNVLRDALQQRRQYPEKNYILFYRDSSEHYNKILFLISILW